MEICLYRLPANYTCQENERKTQWSTLFNNYYLQISISSYVLVFIEEIVYRIGMVFVQIRMSLYILIVLKNPSIAIFALISCIYCW